MTESKLFKDYIDQKYILKQESNMRMNNLINQIDLYENKIDKLQTKISEVENENAKLNSEKIELNQKVEVLTEIINNPESFNKYVDENGNINLPYYNGEEGNDYMNNINNGNEEQNEKK